MNKLATAMQEGEYDAERPPSKVGGELCGGDSGAQRSRTWQGCCSLWKDWEAGAGNPESAALLRRQGFPYVQPSLEGAC